MFSRLLAVSLCLIFIHAASAQTQVRFVNAVEGQTLTFTSDKLSPVTLAYQQVSTYATVSNGNLTVTNVTTATGTQLTVSIAVSFDYFATVAAVYKNGSFFLVIFKDTFANLNTNATYVRLIDLGESIRYISVATPTADIFTFVGFLELTPYVEIPTSTASLTVKETQGSATYPVSLGTGLLAGNTYTIFFFTPSTGGAGNLATDRVVVAAVTTGFALTSGATNATLTSGAANTTATSGALTSGRATTGRATTGSVGTSGSVTSGSAATSGAASITSGIVATSGVHATTERATTGIRVTTAGVISSTSSNNNASGASTIVPLFASMMLLALFVC